MNHAAISRNGQSCEQVQILWNPKINSSICTHLPQAANVGGTHPLKPLCSVQSNATQAVPMRFGLNSSLMRPAKSVLGVGSWSLWRLSVLFSTWHFVALITFSVGFLLTRVELPHRNAFQTDLPERSCSPGPQPPVQKMVWMIIDALRWDFVSNSSSSISGASAGAMPILQSIACAAVCLTSWQPTVTGMYTYSSCIICAVFAGTSCFADQVCR